MDSEQVDAVVIGAGVVGLAVGRALARAGIRPRIHGPDDSPADFMTQGPAEHGLAGAVNLFGIESPGLTASLALADRVLRRLA